MLLFFEEENEEPPFVGTFIEAPKPDSPYLRRGGQSCGLSLLDGEGGKGHRSLHEVHITLGIDHVAIGKLV